MPELPDLQIFSRNLNRILAGKKIKEVYVNTEKLNVSAKELSSALADHEIKRVYRDGKELIFELSKDQVFALHLMLRGKLYFDELYEKHNYTLLELLFEDDTRLSLTDFQRAATITLNPEKKTAPDALSEKADAGFLKEKMLKSRTAIKNLLLDQHFIRGIGNAYADEILWDAGISPLSVSNKIPVEKIKKLAGSITSVLKDAEEAIRKTHPDIISGEVRDFLKIHNPKKKTSPRGAAILVTKSGSGKTYYTDEQELFK